jgi:hypothetical protein
MADEDPVFGDVIYSYTRKQAIEPASSCASTSS